MSVMKREHKIIVIGQISVYFGLCILALRHFYVAPANHFIIVAVIMLVGFIPSLLYLRFFSRYTPFALVTNALILVTFIFTLMREWALAGVFILVPVYSLLFKERFIYIFASIAAAILNISVIVLFFFKSYMDVQTLVIVLDIMTIFFILVFLIYFVSKDLILQSTMEAKQMQTILTLTKSVEFRDPYTHGHSDRVAYLGQWIAEHVAGLDAQTIFHAGLIHDVGKLSIPDAVLLKPSRLSEEEFKLMKTHTTHGANICNSLNVPDAIVKGVLHHHERWDGKGYPSGLSGEQIPIIGRVLSVADSIDAMSSNRAYRSAMSMERIRSELIRCSGTQFDPELIRIALDQWEKVEEFYSETAEAAIQEMG